MGSLEVNKTLSNGPLYFREASIHAILRFIRERRSLSLANSVILYCRSLVTDVDKSRYVLNRGLDKTKNAKVFASNHLYLNGSSQKVDYDIIHELGENSRQIATSAAGGWTIGNDHSYTGLMATGYIYNLSTVTDGVVYVTYRISSYLGGSFEGNNKTGTYTVKKVLDGSGLNLSGASFSGVVNIDSVVEITLPANSYLTYFDVETKDWVRGGSISGDILLEPDYTHPMLVSHSHVFTHTAPLSEDDYILMSTDPDVIKRVVYENFVMSSGFSKSDIVRFWPCSEGSYGIGAESIQEVMTNVNKAITSYGPECRTTYENVDYGPTNLLIVQDENGDIVDTANPDTFSFNSDGSYYSVACDFSGRWTITIVLELNGSTGRYFGADASMLSIGEVSPGRLRVSLNGVAYEKDLGTGMFWVAITSEGKIFTQGTLDTTIDMTGFSLASDFYFGKLPGETVNYFNASVGCFTFNETIFVDSDIATFFAMSTDIIYGLTTETGEYLTQEDGTILTEDF